MKAKYKFVYSTRFPQEKKPNCVSMKNYQLRYNYETMESFTDAVHKNDIPYITDNAIIQQSLIDRIQPNEIPILRLSQESVPLYSKNYEPTVGNYQTFPDYEKMQRKRRYIEYFQRHYGTK